MNICFKKLKIYLFQVTDSVLMSRNSNSYGSQNCQKRLIRSLRMIRGPMARKRNLLINIFSRQTEKAANGHLITKNAK